jgi:hypothetical protein
MLQAVVEKAQAMESGEFPRFLFRIPPGIGSLALDPTHIEAPLVEFLRLCMRRAKAKGLVLIALGQGPVNLEIVLEDSGPEPQPETVRLLLDWKEPIRPERLGLDKELYQAHTLVQRAAGSATVECRIDGGLRLRLRLPFYRTPNQSGVAV